MPHIPHTPESLLSRSDSKNPETTCRALTASGRPCRRSIISPLKSSGGSSNPVAVGADTGHDLDTINEEELIEAYFCWQHKDQAERPVKAKKTLIPLHERNSVDTLVSRLGVLNLTSSATTNEPAQVDVPRCTMREKPRKHIKQKTRPSLLSLLCCGASADDDEVYVKVVKVRKSSAREANPLQSAISNISIPENRRENARRDVGVESEAPSSTPFTSAQKPRPSFMPAKLSPHIAAQLFTEASKPISAADKEGYIYMYWLTNEPMMSPTHVSCLLDPSSPTRHNHGNQQSPPPSTFANSLPGLTPSNKNTIVVKIGRATNVHRRLSSWQQQCGYNLSLIRFYPYVPSKRSLVNPDSRENTVHKYSPSESNTPGVRKVPYCHRVERLIHLELSENRVRQDKCITCGKEHREWFEIEANREAVTRIDEVIRRWVAWAEQLAQAQDCA